MKPSRYTFLIVPDNDGKNRQFAMSRKGTFLLLCSIIGIISGMVIALFILIPKSIDYQKMENRYNEVIEERIEVLGSLSKRNLKLNFKSSSLVTFLFVRSL